MTVKEDQSSPLNSRLNLFGDTLLSSAGACSGVEVQGKFNCMASLQQCEGMLRAIVNQAIVGFAQADLDGRLTFVNDRYCDITGYSRDELLGRHWLDLTHPYDRQENAEGFEQMLCNRKTHIIEKRYLRKDGAIIWVSVGPSLIHDADGKMVGSAAFIVDISARKAAADALQKSEENLNRAQAVGHIGSWIIDIPSGRLDWSAETFRMFGISPHEPVNLAIFAATVHPADRDFVMHAWSEAVTRDATYDVEHRIVVGGKTRWVRERAHIERDPAGSPLTGIGTVQDITGKKILEKEIQERRNEMAELQKLQTASQTAAAFAHELNQPLLAIASYSEAALIMLQSEKPDLDKVRKAIGESERQVYRAGQSIRNLLALLSLKEFPAEEFDLNTEIITILDAARLEYELQFHSKLNLDKQLPLVLANRIHVQKALLNLLYNCVEAMQGAGVQASAIIVTVSTSKDGGYVQLTIQDNGPGIRQEDFDRLFEPFFTTKATGIGMGLAVSRSLIEANGGQLWADPQSGSGAIFHLTLPIAA